MRSEKYLSRSLPAVITAIVTFLAYIPSLSGSFLNYDDWLYYEDSHITAFSLTKAFTEAVAGNWHPLTVISYAIDYKLWGLDAFWFHLENNILHSLNALLVFILAVTLFGKARRNADKFFAGAFAALLFGLHPLHVESVSWIAERKDVLCGFFFLLSLIAYLSFVDAPSGKRAFKYAATLVLFALALLSKPMAVTLPVVLLITDIYPLGRIKRLSDLKTVLPDKIPFFLLSLGSGLLTIWAQATGGAVAPIELLPFTWRLWFSARAVVFYMYKTLVPAGLAPFYPMDVNNDYFGLGGSLSIVIILGVTVVTLIMLGKRNIFFAVWSYFIVTLLPVLGIIQVGGQAAADRYMYLPSLGFFLLAGAGLMAAPEVNKKFAAFACALVILAALSLLTIKQQSVWKNSVTLWNREIERFPGFYRGYNNRGSAWAEAGKFREAIADYNAAISLKETYAEVYVNRGMAYQRLGEYALAKQDFLDAIRLNPMFAEAEHNLALTLISMGNFEEAAEAERKAKELGYK
jgi:hypothetical protein